jgi:hypothetical protein
MGADQQLPPIAAIEDVIEALRRLGVGVGVDESVPASTLRWRTARSARPHSPIERAAWFAAGGG